MDELMRVALSVNGRLVEADVEPRTLLIDFIRDVAHFTGPHIGCDEGACEPAPSRSTVQRSNRAWHSRLRLMAPA